nr:unnamed protein product [Digitaria exilis]
MDTRRHRTAETSPLHRERARHTKINREGEGDGAWGGVTVSRAPPPHGAGRRGHTRSAKRGRDHLHGQLLPFPLARAVRPSIAYLPSPCSTRFISRRPLHITTVSHPSLKGRTPSSFLRAQSIRRRLQLASP